MPFTAIVLAAQRPGIVNPLAAEHGVSHKCLVSIAGAPLIEHVIGTLARMPALSTLRISVEPELWATLDRLLARYRRPGLALEMVKAEPSLADSVIAAATGAGPFLITTADNVLMTEQAVGMMLDALEHCDGCAMLTTREAVLAIHPEAQRRFYRLADAHYSNCNLYGIAGAKALGAVELFRTGGQFRRHIGRALNAVGIVNVALAVAGLISREGAARRLSRRLKLDLRFLKSQDGALAIDVDNARTHAIAEPVLAARLERAPEMRAAE